MVTGPETRNDPEGDRLMAGAEVVDRLATRISQLAVHMRAEAISDPRDAEIVDDDRKTPEDFGRLLDSHVAATKIDLSRLA